MLPVLCRRIRANTGKADREVHGEGARAETPRVAPVIGIGKEVPHYPQSLPQAVRAVECRATAAPFGQPAVLTRSGSGTRRLIAGNLLFDRKEDSGALIGCASPAIERYSGFGNLT